MQNVYSKTQCITFYPLVKWHLNVLPSYAVYLRTCIQYIDNHLNLDKLLNLTKQFGWWTTNRPAINLAQNVGKRQKKVCLADSHSQFSQQTLYIELGQHCKAGYEL